MEQANMQVVDYISENVLQTHLMDSDIAWVISMMLLRMQKFGLVGDTLDINQLTQNLKTEL